MPHVRRKRRRTGSGSGVLISPLFCVDEQTLTDPVARENYEKYGNPDGRQSLAVRSV